ncbi:uncharacterized protein LOC129617826 [Condylostylus longicornis]|uniref:uncharacterized protein LOC129617826 n=1 Tax=Condylostylus longicornis TaxID=2530218 RepID=UPI00244DA8AD|nr:uncharacterized protein LOC129617826 [Condylostylus longicornis]
MDLCKSPTQSVDPQSPSGGTAATQSDGTPSNGTAAPQSDGTAVPQPDGTAAPQSDGTQPDGPSVKTLFGTPSDGVQQAAQDALKKADQDVVRDWEALLKKDRANDVLKALDRIQWENKDIMALDVDAIVNTANAKLNFAEAGGISGALHKGIPKLHEAGQEFNQSHGNLKPGEAVVFPIDCKYKCIVHVLGPQIASNSTRTIQECKDLVQSYDSVFDQVKNVNEKGGTIRSIGMPSISTGIFNYPLDEGTVIAVTRIIEGLINQQSLIVVMNRFNEKLVHGLVNLLVLSHS